MSDVEKPVKIVRNILANELGLSRDRVEELIKERIDQHLRRMDLEHLVNRAVVSVLNDKVRTSQWDRTTIRSAIMDAARQYIANSFELSVRVKVPTSNDTL